MQDLKEIVISILPEHLKQYIGYVGVKQFKKGVYTLSVGVNHAGIVFEMDYKLKARRKPLNDLCTEILGEDFKNYKIRVWFMSYMQQEKRKEPTNKCEFDIQKIPVIKI